ncbi:MAG: endonuclease III [Acidimicrobiia bacterium]|nr:endonuclease III [Acidimicrobiia bacterium]
MGKPRSPKGRAVVVLGRLGAEHPGSAAELATLDHRNPFELLVATVLSAQTTDVGVNKVTPELFARYPTPADLAVADPAALEVLLKPTGFYRAKARSVLGLAAALVERHGGEVPGGMPELTALPGVGRKTANVVRSIALGLPGLPVDTHVGRVARRLGLIEATDPVKAEAELGRLVPTAERGRFSLLLILHGRTICIARRPRCADCSLNDICPSAFRAMDGKP